MKLVVDTNTIVSGSLWQGPPARLISAAIVTGDKDLLALKAFEGSLILKVRAALDMLGIPAE